MIEGRGLTKRFGGVTALNAVDIKVEPGRITALLGENGAGKSTLVACLSGAHQPDHGDVLVDGLPVRFRSPDDARRAGIAVIHQEPQMLEEQSVAANIYLPRLAPGSSLRTGRRELEIMASKHLATLEIRDLDPGAKMRGIKGAQRQLVEIARALIDQPKVLFLDEPNASLGEAESERLFAVVRGLRDRGVAVVLVSHRLREVYSISDHVVVMRDGVKVADAPVSKLPVEQAVGFITGGAKRIGEAPVAAAAPVNDNRAPLLTVKSLTGPGFTHVSFDIRPGEILGMSGLVGSGRTEIALAAIGAARASAGTIEVDGQPVQFRDPSQALQAGIAFVPEGRRDAVFYGQSVDFNIRSGFWGKRSGPHRGRAAETGAVRNLMAQLKVKAQGPDARASTLSGGNQQKLLFARALSTNPRLLILDEPTHGVDVGTKREIHDLVRSLATEGLAVWFISSEVEEVVELATRILVVHQGRIAGELPGGSSIEDVLARNFGEQGVLNG
ncbi:MAG: sugar ABC transporter ATP-binding protein [Devosia sp.]|uniref:sugar ABC transporter ATP-binding protein n=1 Tax=Devosia sp. TaxID=1871048 RepID=UPI001A51E6E3|nr:sugar ABC transporter ATP-binding protein [Devosia sp.]MBL8600045.1 sugar ABC transporter ATP-binding protein [Devosia sp.]